MEEKTGHTSANEVLEACRDKFPAVLVIGLTDDRIPVFNTNVGDYQFLQWLLNRSSLELLLHEKNQDAETRNREAKEALDKLAAVKAEK